MNNAENVVVNKTPQKKKKNKNKKIIIALIIVVVVLAAVGVGIAFAYNSLVTKLDKVDNVSLEGKDLDINDQVAEDLSDYRNILLLGIDTRAGESDENCRSDANIIVSINEKTNKIKLISIVRDSYLDLEENGNHVIDKLTHAHAYGGPINTIRALNRNLDLNISDFARVNWQTVADLVDNIGGLEVTIKDYEIDEMNKYIKDTNKSLKGDMTPIKKAGKQKLNGIQAVTYCRIRKVGNGDVERAQRMRKTVNGAYEKVKTLKLSELDALANKTLPEITTSLSSKEMAKLLMGFSSYKVEDSEGWPYNWDGAMINGVSYDVPITLESNVIALHKNAFGQKNYTPTDTVLKISDKVAADSGYYGTQD